MNKRIGWILAVVVALPMPELAWAVDSYRYLHVTPETPWYIFLFLLPIVVSPFILMAILYWYFAWRKPAARDDREEE
ncbi:MAG: hypothetical protein IT489_11645 [Gammaproteobacteria bacterium]|nr:hypothetical protein [Gammaproteobacteria bacterium]